ncbi:MAG: GAF domain-containing protein [Chloroflexi bacterium]|nr:GAF domain-containing protein [Chloroflexota bacterium]
MAWLANLTLQRRIALLVIGGLVVSLGLFSWIGIQSVNESVARTLAERLTLARMIARHLDEDLSHVTADLLSVAYFGGDLPDNKEFQSEVVPLRERLAELGVWTENILLLDGSGKVIYAEPEGSISARTDLHGYTEVSETLEMGALTISGLVSGPFVNGPVVLINAPVTNSEGGVLGALVSVIDIERLGISHLTPITSVGETDYVEMVDQNGVVLARTQPGVPPASFERSDHPGRFAELIEQNKATVRTCHRCHETRERIERHRDVLAFAPLTTASWGIAIRQSEEEALAPTRQLQQRLLFLGLIMLVVALSMVWVMLRDVVRPVRMLTAAAKRVASGDFKASVHFKRRDEIGQLGSAFHSMTQELARSRNELLLRNEELSALNAIAATVSQSLNLEDVLVNALQKVLDVTKTTVGCVFLREPGSGKLEMMASIGSATAFNCEESGSGEAVCACHQVTRYGQTLMVNDKTQCPVLGTAMMTGVAGFVSVPLKSKDRTLGIINVACSGKRFFTDSDFELLDSIGSHVGLAIENSVLYEEAKQKEKLRGQLLNSVMSAEEEERKRIARELHDEYGQTLTGLIMTIESLETALPEKSPHMAKLQNAKAVLSRALQDIRRLTLDLRPAALDDLGLVAAIRGYIETHLKPEGIDVQFEARNVNRRLPATIETNLFRIIQEACHNILKHAEARQVRIQLRVKSGKMVATVADDGRGFVMDAVFRARLGVKSLGLLGMQERAALVGGTLDIKTQVDRGTTITVEIPLPGELTEAGVSREGKDEAEAT